ncbi:MULTISPECIES: TetR/AcrR family transcriptional regulator [unclassified Nocardioides]|uniref:TetR/AcrR family transcriptional regulator n=1 Tax=unclassified Nocardioides TaxID=2615069 RepID=UPI00360BC2E3
MSANDTSTPRRTIGRPGPAEDGRLAILEAAGRAFASRGYLATSIDAIADELGATKGRVYHYYRGKAEIFLDVVVSGMIELIEEIAPLASGSGTPPERMYAMAHRHAELMMIHHGPQRVSVQAVEMRTVPEIRVHSDLLDEVLELRRRYERLFVATVEQGIETGDFDVLDAGLAVKSALGSLNWIPIWYSPDRSETDDVPRVAAAFATFIVNGLRKRS